MQTKTKRVSFFKTIAMSVAALVVCAASFGFSGGVVKTAAAEPTQTKAATRYYYDELMNSPLAQKFYETFLQMANDGDFKDGVKARDLTSVVSAADLNDYLVKSAPKIPVAFGAARDAFYMDHPELFYADVYKMYVTAGTKDGKDFISVDAGRSANYYKDNTFDTAAEVNGAIVDFNKAVDAAVAAANKGENTADKVRNANKYLAEKVKYDYSLGATKKSDGSIEYNGNIYTAYGALVQSKAVCEGYSRAFKVIMDELDIPCVVINGAVSSGVVGTKNESGLAPHSWNAVEIDGLWYGVDVTYNVGAGKLEKFTLVGDDFLARDHFEDGVISSSGFELKYPALRALDYGVNEDASGFEFKDSGKLGDTPLGYIENPYTPGDYTLYLAVNYKGKNPRQLKAEGKYLAVRFGDNMPWLDMNAMNDFYVANGMDLIIDNYMLFTPANTVEYLQFAVINKAPDCEADMGLVEPLPNAGYADLKSEDISALSAKYLNKCYGKRVNAPYVKKITPSEKGWITKFDPIDVTIEYDEKLVYTEGNDKDDIKIEVTGYYHDDLDDWITVENINWDASKNTISFKFTPSKYFIHNCETYSFVPTCLVGETSRKAPDAGRLAFKMKQVVCPKVFNDGRLYMQVFGAPQFVSASDESMNGFKDGNGQPIVGDQRSQLMLVVNEPKKSESDSMKTAAKEQMGLNDSDIKASSTYQIDLQMCGLIQKVPTGSYMQVGFGFPEGYGPDDAGVTFTVYHYTRKPDGTIDEVQEVPCVVTEYGIIATVKSFSPFMICAIDSSKASKTKNVYATVDGIGGKVENAEIRQVAENGSTTFKIVKDAGYEYYKVTLNGVDVKDRIAADGTLSLSYAELNGSKIGDKTIANSNVLEVSFISSRAQKYYADNNIEVADPKIIVKSEDIFAAYAPTPTVPRGKSNVGLIVGIVVPLVVLALAGCGVALLFILRKKKEPVKADGAKAEKNGSSKSTPVINRTSVNNAARRPSASRPTDTANRSANTASRPTSQRPTNNDKNKK